MTVVKDLTATGRLSTYLWAQTINLYDFYHPPVLPSSLSLTAVSAPSHLPGTALLYEVDHSTYLSQRVGQQTQIYRYPMNQL